MDTTTSEIGGIGVEPVPQAETPATNGEQSPPPVAVAVEVEIDSTKEPVEIVLDHPVEFDGKRYDRLRLNMVGLSRKQWKQIKRTFRGLDTSFQPFPVDDEDYQAVVAAEAAQVPLLLMDAIHPMDWARVSGAVFQFLGKRLEPRLTRPRY